MTNADSRKVPLATLPTPSTAIVSDVELTTDGGSAALRFAFDRNGVIFRSGVSFSRVRASRWRAEGHCTAWHIEGAYDTVVEILESPWIDELQNSQSTRSIRSWTMRHFMLYLDSAGCFEFVAESYALLPEEVTV
jgi:hypothetical protein